MMLPQIDSRTCEITKILGTLNQVTVAGVSQSSYAQNMNSVLPMKMVLYVVSEPIILGFKSKTKTRSSL